MSSLKRKEGEESSDALINEQESKKMKFETPEPIKFMCCGSILGDFVAFNNKITHLDEANGMFHFVLCVGDFFSSEDEHIQQFKGANSYESQKFLTGESRFLVPVYFLDTNSENDLINDKEGVEIEIAPNLFYLGSTFSAKI